MVRAPRVPLALRPLTAQAFAPFGQVIDTESAAQRVAIYAGTCQRHHDLGRPSADGGALAFNLFVADAVACPAPLRLMERHHRGSQSFAPFGAALRMVIVVAAPTLDAAALAPEHLHGFITDGHQGINLNPGVWHHPLLALDAGPWLVVDRVGAPGEAPDCEVLDISHWHLEVNN